MAEIVPAILSSDESDFRKKYAELFGLSHHFRELHVDFIDGKFLPQKTILPGDGCRLRAPFRLTAHLMVKDPTKYFAMAKNEGYSTVIFQFEALENEAELMSAVELARTLGLRVGISINPETPLSAIRKFIPDVDIVQIMSVHPGSQGQTFIPESLDKVRELRHASKRVIISIDGGIKTGIARQAAAAGADIIVAGSAIVRAQDEEAALEVLKQDIE